MRQMANHHTRAATTSCLHFGLARAMRKSARTHDLHIVRPVPVRIETQRLYYDAAEHGINAAQVHAALEWKRQWTTYEPEQVMLDREQGARNPSPGTSNNTDNDDDDQRVILWPKREREDDIGLGTDSVREESWDPADDDEDGDDPISDLSSSPQGFFATTTEIVRPVAIRAQQYGPPALINDEVLERPLSPITMYSMGSQGSSHHSLKGMTVSFGSVHSEKEILTAREGLLSALASSGGDADDEEFQECLNILEYSTAQASGKGMWLTLTKPTFFGCLGFNEDGDPMYTLARMSFDMFTPGDLVCSLQGNFNEVSDVPDVQRSDLNIPKSLVDEVLDRSTSLKTYNIITAFTIEPTQSNTSSSRTVLRPIRATMTTFGYMIPDPKEEGRNSVWMTGGRIEPNRTDEDISLWKDLFPGGKRPPHNWGAAARILAVKWLMGAQLSDEADANGAFEYTFTRPLGGHGLAYIDTLYNDESLRIVRGHRGTIFCFARVE